MLRRAPLRPLLTSDPIMQRRALLRLPLALSLALTLTQTLSGCSEEKAASAPRAPLPVDTIRVSAADEPHWSETVAQAEAGAGIDVKAQVTGRLLRISCTEGDAVKAGDVLFEIDPASLQAELEAAEASRRQAESELAQAEREWRRAKSLLDSGAGSRRDFDDAASARSQRAASLAQAKANEAQARISLGWTRIVAPVDGFISRAELKPGSVIVRESTVLASITQTDDVRVLFSPSDRDLAGAEINKETPVRIFRADGQELPAQIDFVASEYDPARSTRSIRAKIPGGLGVLPGEFLRVRLRTTIDRGAWRVPQRAVRQLPDGTYAVFTLRDGKARQTAVEVGLWEGKDWVIRKGLADGDRVIVSQLIKLQDGVAVSEDTRKD